MNERRLVLVGQAAPLREEKWVKGCATPTNKTNQSYSSTKKENEQTNSFLSGLSAKSEWNEWVDERSGKELCLWMAHQVNFIDAASPSTTPAKQKKMKFALRRLVEWVLLLFSSLFFSSSSSLPSFLSLFDGGVGRQKRRRKISWFVFGCWLWAAAPLAACAFHFVLYWRTPLQPTRPLSLIEEKKRIALLIGLLKKEEEMKWSSWLVNSCRQ